MRGAYAYANTNANAQITAVRHDLIVLGSERG
jgi:hypothetical protein